nr:DNA polymerase III subunit chi [Polymorphobacter sp.]
MIDINFYQLATRPPEAILTQLVPKALAAGHRIAIRSADLALLTRIDVALWSTPADSFHPHAIDTDAPDRAASQPILLTAAPLPAANAADCLAQIGDDLPDDLTGLTRVWFLFDADSVETARSRWRTLSKSETVRPVYWRETEDGRFEKAA